MLSPRTTSAGNKPRSVPPAAAGNISVSARCAPPRPFSAGDKESTAVCPGDNAAALPLELCSRGWMWPAPSAGTLPSSRGGGGEGVAAAPRSPQSLNPPCTAELSALPPRPPRAAGAVTLGSVLREVAGKGNPLWRQRSGPAALPCLWLPWGRCLRNGGATRSPRGDRIGLRDVG